MSRWYLKQNLTLTYASESILCLLSCTNHVFFFFLGLVPMIKQLKHCEKVLGSLEPIESLKDLCGDIQTEAVISG